MIGFRMSCQYEKLEKYKNELEKINQYNQQVLEDLENQITNSDDIHLDQINEEIEVIKRVIDEKSRIGTSNYKIVPNGI